MKITRVIACLALMMPGAWGAAPAAAQAFNPPAELPPADYRGSQFVDSAGCVYIRAGVNGAATWVPRVTRDRKPVCGYKPSFAASSASAPVAGTTRASAAPATSSPPPATIPPAAAQIGDVVAVQGAETQVITPTTRILPRHLYDLRQSQKPVKTPRGYRAAWQDDRLNLRRAEQTLAGQEQMRGIWTDTVPRRLVRP